MSEAGAARRVRKEAFAARLREYLDTYKNVLIVQVDNVGSSQMQKVRLALRGKAAVLMGKNTLVRNTIRKHIAEGKNTHLENLLPLVYGNMGFVFTNTNLKEIRDLVLENKVPAAAKTGSFAPSDVHVPAGPTGMDPGQTAFFQALNIATKIIKGAIEIVNPVHLIKAGDKVTLSHVTLLAKLNILPFFYGFKVTDVYEDGTVYKSEILDMSQDTLLEKFKTGVQKLAAISLAISYPTLASLPFLVSVPSPNCWPSLWPPIMNLSNPKSSRRPWQILRRLLLLLLQQRRPELLQQQPRKKRNQQPRRRNPMRTSEEDSQCSIERTQHIPTKNWRAEPRREGGRKRAVEQCSVSTFDLFLSLFPFPANPTSFISVFPSVSLF